MSDDTAIADDGLSRRDGIDGALPYAVYTGVQTLEKHPKTAIFCNFFGPSGGLAVAYARSVTRCGVRRSGMICARPGHPRTDLHRCTKTATTNCADCTLSMAAQNCTRPVRKAAAHPSQVWKTQPMSRSILHLAAQQGDLHGSPPRTAEVPPGISAVVQCLK
jgi:hypothetical protein